MSRAARLSHDLESLRASGVVLEFASMSDDDAPRGTRWLLQVPVVGTLWYTVAEAEAFVAGAQAAARAVEALR